MSEAGEPSVRLRSASDEQLFCRSVVAAAALQQQLRQLQRLQQQQTGAPAAP